MCNFHSTVWRLLGQEVQTAHTPDNSHTGMIEKAGWKVNQPNAAIVVFEAEWNGIGEVPPITKLIRNSGECPTQVERAVIEHYTKLRDFLASGKDWKYFSVFEKYADVWARLKVLPQGVVFPKDCGYLNLSGLTSLPQGVVFPEKIGGSLYLSGLTSLPQGVVFPKDCGYLDLRGDLKAQLKRKP